MLVLGIDTSCDDTSASLLEATGAQIKTLSNVVSNQESIHNRYGGIVPELASRSHMQKIWPVVDEAMAGEKLSSLSAIAVCSGPGLIGSLLVGCSFAKSLCFSKGIPLVAVNHHEGHVLSVFLETPSPEFPFLSLTVSGGHTCIYRVDGYGQYIELGRTRDDAAGEAFDKVSKLLGLGYPGGPIIDKLSRQGDPKAVKFPRPYLPGSMDFSFSGLKTAVKLHVRDMPLDELQQSTPDICASFQAAVVDTLVRKTEWAIKQQQIKRVTLSGGVAANQELREKMSEMAGKREVELYMPAPALCTDNAAMIALAGYHRFLAGETAPMDLNPKAHLPLGVPAAV